MKAYKIVMLAVSAIIAASCHKSEIEPLNAAFETNSTEIGIGEKVTFKDISTGNPTRWNWTFEGGEPETSILFSPEITYNHPGTYSVKLTVQRGDEKSEIVKKQYITVNYPSVINADFSADKSSVTEGETIIFTDKSTGYPVEWSWTFKSDQGTVITSDEQNPAVVFETAGIYSVSLTAKNPAGENTKMAENYITVIDKNAVSADFSVSCRDTYAGGTVTFMDTSIGSRPESWEWTFEGGNPASSAEQNPVVMYSAPGKYKVTLKVVNGDFTDEKTKEGYINVIPSDGLVLFYPFDGTSADAGPNGIDPQTVTVGKSVLDFNAETRFTGDNAENRSSALFSSTDASNYSVLRVPDQGILDHFDISGDFSVSCWVRVDELPDGKKYVIYHYGAAPGMPNGSSQSWFRITTDAKHVVFCIELTGSSGNWNEYQGQKQYDDGLWHHYVCIYKKDENGKRDSWLYIDGEVAASSLDKPDKIIETTPFYLGTGYRYTNNAFAPENFMNGQIDDFIFYNRALSEEEITALYNNR